MTGKLFFKLVASYLIQNQHSESSGFFTADAKRNMLFSGMPISSTQTCASQIASQVGSTTSQPGNGTNDPSLRCSSCCSGPSTPVGRDLGRTRLPTADFYLMLIVSTLSSLEALGWMPSGSSALFTSWVLMRSRTSAPATSPGLCSQKPSLCRSVRELFGTCRKARWQKPLLHQAGSPSSGSAFSPPLSHHPIVSLAGFLPLLHFKAFPLPRCLLRQGLLTFCLGIPCGQRPERLSAPLAWSRLPFSEGRGFLEWAKHRGNGREEKDVTFSQSIMGGGLSQELFCPPRCAPPTCPAPLPCQCRFLQLNMRGGERNEGSGGCTYYDSAAGGWWVGGCAASWKTPLPCPPPRPCRFCLLGS